MTARPENVVPIDRAFKRGSRALELCVLVVEDDAADAYLIDRALMANPIIGSVVHARDAAEALWLILTGAVASDVVLIDLHMERNSGFQRLIDCAALDPPNFPAVVLTCLTAPTKAMRQRLRGALCVTSKPDTVGALEQFLAMAVTSACRPWPLSA